MRSGQLDNLLELQTAAETPNPSGLGDPVRTWSEIDKVWGTVEPLRGKERERVRTISADIDYRVRVPFSQSIKDLVPKDRVIHEGMILEIVSVSNYLERGIFMELLCKREV